MSEQYGLDVRF